MRLIPKLFQNSSRILFPDLHFSNTSISRTAKQHSTLLNIWHTDLDKNRLTEKKRPMLRYMYDRTLTNFPYGKVKKDIEKMENNQLTVYTHFFF